MPTQLLMPETDVPVLDQSRLLEEFGDEPEILAELRDLFLEHIPPLLEKIQQAWQARDCEGVASAAHSLKGASSTYGALRLAQVSLELENMARLGDLADFAEGINLLEDELAKVTQMLHQLDNMV